MNLTMKEKLIFLTLVCLCVPVLVVGFFWYTKSSDIITRKAMEYNNLLVEQTNDYLDAYFKDIERITIPLITHPLLLQFIHIDRDDQYSVYLVNNQIKGQLYSNFIYGRDDIFNFILMSGEGPIFSSNPLESSGFDVKHYRNLLAAEPFPQSYRLDGTSLRHPDGQALPVFTVHRSFRDSLYPDKRGLIVIDLNLNQISKISQKIKLGSNGFLWIMDAQGNYSFHPDKQRFGQPVPTSYVDETKLKSSGFFIDESTGVKKMMIYYKSEFTNWVTFFEVPYSELVGELSQLLSITLWVLVLLSVIVLTTLGGYSFYLTNSLLVLVRLMKQVETGDLKVRAPVPADDKEIGRLNRGFNNMLTEMDRLVGEVHTSQLQAKEMQIRQKESIIQTMQAQINPHFLYNTLEVINSHAIVEEVMTISNMVTSLGDMFRYNVNSTTPLVALQEEIRHIGLYFMFHKERHSAFEWEVDLDEAVIARVRCIRLTVQPIIENAFKHGYEAFGLPPKFIRLSGEKQEDGYVLRVVDKGKGMTRALMDRYNRFFANVDGEAGGGMTGTTGSGTGLGNAHTRLFLTFGYPYGLQIERSDESGTVISIRLPYMTDQDAGPAEGDEDACTTS